MISSLPLPDAFTVQPTTHDSFGFPPGGSVSLAGLRAPGTVTGLTDGPTEGMQTPASLGVLLPLWKRALTPGSPSVTRAPLLRPSHSPWARPELQSECAARPRAARPGLRRWRTGRRTRSALRSHGRRTRWLCAPAQSAVQTTETTRARDKVIEKQPPPPRPVHHRDPGGAQFYGRGNTLPEQ